MSSCLPNAAYSQSFPSTNAQDNDANSHMERCVSLSHLLQPFDDYKQHCLSLDEGDGSMEMNSEGGKSTLRSKGTRSQARHSLPSIPTVRTPPSDLWQFTVLRTKDSNADIAPQSLNSSPKNDSPSRAVPDYMFPPTPPGLSRRHIISSGINDPLTPSRPTINSTNTNDHTIASPSTTLIQQPTGPRLKNIRASSVPPDFPVHSDSGSVRALEVSLPHGAVGVQDEDAVSIPIPSTPAFGHRTLLAPQPVAPRPQRSILGGIHSSGTIENNNHSPPIQYINPFQLLSPHELAVRASQVLLARLEDMKKVHPHMPDMVSLFNPLRDTAPLNAWCFLPHGRRGPPRKFKQSLARLPQRNRQECDFACYPRFPEVFLDYRKHCQYCRRDSLGNKLLALKLWHNRYGSDTYSEEEFEESPSSSRSSLSNEESKDDPITERASTPPPEERHIMDTDMDVDEFENPFFDDSELDDDNQEIPGILDSPIMRDIDSFDHVYEDDEDAILEEAGEFYIGRALY